MFYVICVQDTNLWPKHHKGSVRSKSYFASGGQGKNMGSQSETLAIYIKITYLNKELWNIFQYQPQWAQLCQHVWASRNISVHFQIKYLTSFLSPYQIHILKTRKNDVFDEGKRYFCFSKHCDHNATLGARDFSGAVSGFCQVFIVTLLAVSAFGQRRKFPPHARKTSGTWYPGITTRETRRKEILTDSVSGSPNTLYNKHQTEQHTTVDYGLRTADCGLWTMDSVPHLREKNSSAHIVILKRF